MIKCGKIQPRCILSEKNKESICDLNKIKTDFDTGRGDKQRYNMYIKKNVIKCD